MLDVTSYWVSFQKYRQKAGVVVAGLLLFLSGWQLGRVTSPYYTAQPIVFQDRECNGCSDSGGSLTELQDLQAESAALAAPTTTKAVAGASTTEGSGTFVASVNSTLYHHNTCSSASRIKEENKIWFASVQEAEDAGYSASACTKEKLQ